MEWLCYEYCSASKCNSTYYELWSHCRLVDLGGKILDSKRTYYGCKC